MVAAVDDKPTILAKNSQRVLTEGKANKIVKKTRERKQQSKNLDVDVVLEAVDQTSPESSEDIFDGREKKSQGIVIDGRTYTCATCKTGHRVGICKHARERPMTATHPPGRPSAGAPKKVVCDCPKQCNCKKRDCKCARNCSCTQVMYMLVYVSAPGEDDTSEENGIWKLGKQVMTDLKGNILTEEQVKERKEQKEAQKIHPEVKKLPKTVSKATKADEAQPTRSCCKHKENVDSRKIAIEASPQTGSVSMAAATGCNCGHLCACPFCPQHPNNSISINMARQQAIYFANQPRNHNYQSIVSFMPNLPQGASCMGGAPQFAISRDSQMPSFHDLQRTFPNPGYVIGYPIWSTRTDSAGYSMAPFPTTAQFVPAATAGAATTTTTAPGVIGDDRLHNMPSATPMSASASMSMASSTPIISPDLPSLEFSLDEFGIGNAFVASAGPGTWNSGYTSNWMDDGGPVSAPVTDNLVEPPDVFAHPIVPPPPPINGPVIQNDIHTHIHNDLPNDIRHDMQSHMHIHDHNPSHNIQNDIPNDMHFGGFDDLHPPHHHHHHHHHDGLDYLDFDTAPSSSQMGEDLTTV